ncbi:AbrB/MazE/SpoVT family DNA-binding domain-containing protein [Halegenticoccus tardaugens]|uniref:AbrB/MazE/SpoVT family DNA-binding domain-containing protein n=1 Tax=Halegenticoccus tardaugens TaxID=2071624 RepID=UPI00100A8899|nr:AbrB/MazE/SpoVT family DNA-binding domain-containing protein [Halegenticoccus tardaugens]
MTDGLNDMPWSPAFFAKQMQKAGEEFTDQQMRWVNQMLSANAGSGTGSPADLVSMGMGMAMFKTRVQSGGRISIPDAEREALDLDEGDIVQTFVIPIKRSPGDHNE